MAHGELQATGSVHLPLLSPSTPSLAFLVAQLTPVPSPLRIVLFCLLASVGRRRGRAMTIFRRDLGYQKRAEERERGRGAGDHETVWRF